MNGLDRKDNSLGYTIYNVLPCCSFCNQAKMDANYEDFINWANKVAKNNPRGLCES